MSGSETILQLRDLEVLFPIKKGVFGKGKGSVRAVNSINLTVSRGETMAIVGESGCGKSTLARTIIGLQKPTSGEIWINGKNMTGAGTRDWRNARREIQMIFQDPFSSLNPRMKIQDIITAPLKAYNVPGDHKRRAKDLLDLVGLDPENHLSRFPHEFSGGQRQRIGIARALAVEPKLLICDEPVSALDVSVQAQVINLLNDLKEELGLSYLFISHDLSVVKHVADRVSVMYLGSFVEKGKREAFFTQPLHPYSNALLSASPLPDPNIEKERARIVLSGEPPSAANLPAGCVFHTRCPLAQNICSKQSPVLEEELNHIAACFFPIDEKNSMLKKAIL